MLNSLAILHASCRILLPLLNSMLKFKTKERKRPSSALLTIL